MAGPTTAERGTRQPKGPSSAGHPGPPSRGGPGVRRLRLSGRRRTLLALAVLVVSGAAAIWLLHGSPWLRAERVRTSGTKVLTPREVEAAAAVPIGSPLISVDTDAIEARLGAKLRRIDSVEAVRSWPDGIVLKVTEREPALIMETGTKFIEVDAKGVRFATVDKAPKDVPVLELTADGSPSLRRFDERRLMTEAVRVTTELPERAAKDLRAVEVRSYDSITLKLAHGRTVLWGSSERGEAKARALTALMKAAPDAGHFDVSAPTAPVASAS
ncbi:cell division protein FtsQ/DivIB [Streptomyces sp. FIT100]|uniref:cell division protein FtsQ/DivIB n=1 Tax=Streptomyces sp. FIT100 TaxID=2837956 RepID=UPI0021C587FC|nr:FtsQ-type POTRA domain-containing protein [Streptomyces sp. FIT100]UUN26385.1 FtsQ-type POTRA domain-containing protein [Streptomyces sp. FIT100]